MNHSLFNIFGCKQPTVNGRDLSEEVVVGNSDGIGVAVKFEDEMFNRSG